MLQMFNCYKWMTVKLTRIQQISDILLGTDSIRSEISSSPCRLLKTKCSEKRFRTAGIYNELCKHILQLDDVQS